MDELNRQYKMVGKREAKPGERVEANHRQPGVVSPDLAEAATSGCMKESNGRSIRGDAAMIRGSEYVTRVFVHTAVKIWEVGFTKEE